MSETSFAVLCQIGVIPIDQNNEIRFSVDAYRGYRYGSIRKYLSSGGYVGATRIGITLTPEIVKAALPMVLALPDDPALVQEVQLGKFAKRPGLSVVIRVSTFQGSKGLDLRQWQEDDVYKGWTKKGIRLPIDKIKEIKTLFAKMADYFEEKNIGEL